MQASVLNFGNTSKNTYWPIVFWLLQWVSFFFSFSFFFLNTGFTLILGKKNSEKMSAFSLMILVGISRSGKTFSISSSWVIFLKSKKTYIFKRKLARSVLLFHFKNTGMVLNSFDSINYPVIEFFWNLTASDITPLNTNTTKWQTHSNNLSAVANKLFDYVWQFCGIDA